MVAINKGLGTKVFSVLIICLAILTVFIKLNTYKLMFTDNQFLSDMIMICCSILILYIVYVITNIIEYLILTTLKVIEIRYFVIYPFIFDKTIRFHPIKLLYNQECIRDVFVQNILFYYPEQTLDWIKKIFLKIKRIKELSLLISLIIAAILIRHLFNVNILLEIMIIYILLFLFSYCYFGMDWKGNRRVLLENDFKRYIFSGRYCSQISNVEYGNYLHHLIENSELENYSAEVFLKVLENYLYSVIYENQVAVSIKEIKKVLSLINNNQKSETLFYIKLLQTKKLIGLIGKQLNNSDYLAYGIELITDNIFELSDENMYGVADKALERLRDYRSFLIEDEMKINIKDHFALDINNLFSSQIEVENKIKQMINT